MTLRHDISSVDDTLYNALADGTVEVTITEGMAPPSPDASLSALSVSPRDIIGFTADRYEYEVGVDSSVGVATVSAIANHGGASVSYAPADTDNGTTGHQVALSAGRNEVTVTVTAQDGMTTQDYSVSVNRGVTDVKGWRADADLDGLRAAGSDYPTDIWSDGTTMWVADFADAKLYAYRLTDGMRDPGKDFDTLAAAGNDYPTGIWSDGVTMWVADSAGLKIYAYKMSDKSRDAGKDFDTLAAGNDNPRGIWSDETTMWVADFLGEIYAYKMSDKSRDAGKDLSADSYVVGLTARGVWSDGATMWVLDSTGDKIYAYNLFARFRDRADPVRGFDTLSAAGNHHPTGIWSDGVTMWVVDSTGDKIYAYKMPGDATLSALSVAPRDIIGFRGVRTSYEVGVDSSVGVATVSATANHAGASVSYAPADADNGTAGHQVALSAGRNEVTVTVTAEDSVTRQDYTVSVNRGVTEPTGWQAGADLDSPRAAGNDDPTGIWSDRTTLWVADNNDAKIYAYQLSDGAQEPDKDFDTLAAAGNDYPTGIWSDGVTMWVADYDDAKLYAYTLSNGMRDISKEFTLDPDNDTPTGIWSDRTTLWVGDDWNNKLYAYTLSDGIRNADRDLALDSSDTKGIWSNGTTIWVTPDGEDSNNTFYAYTLSNMKRNPDNDISYPLSLENRVAKGIWSDGATMWAVDWIDDKVYAYNMPRPSVSVSFEQATYNVVEGSAIAVAVTLSADPVRTVVIPVTAETGQDGAIDADYSIAPTDLRVIFNGGDTEKTLTFTAAQDMDDDDGESVVLAFGTLPDGVTVRVPDQATVKISDGDTANLVVNPTEMDISEMGSDDFSVRLATQPTADVTVSVSSGDTGAATVSSASLTFTSSDWDADQTVTVSGVDDSDTGNVSVTVSLRADSADPEYHGKSGSVNVRVEADHTAGLVVYPTEMTISEWGSREFRVSLATQPTGTRTGVGNLRRHGSGDDVDSRRLPELLPVELER